MEALLYEKFSNINIGDPFFDSLKGDYREFPVWFLRKAKANEFAYIQKVKGAIEGFLYLKIEDGPITDIEPVLDIRQAVKIGTLKINPHGTRLGERFIKKSFDFALSQTIDVVYVTIFERHKKLIELFKKYGFYIYGSKTSDNGVECVLVKDFREDFRNIYQSYPLVHMNNSKKYLLAIYPEYHTRLFPDSILRTESPYDVVKDISHTNSIEKVYICRMRQVLLLKRGDILLIYRTSDEEGRAEYRSVVTSVCVVEDVIPMKSFRNFQHLKEECKNYSVFTDQELKGMFTSSKPHYIIKMTYNIALKKRLIRKTLIDEVGLDRDSYWGFFEISDQHLQKILELGEVDESYIVY